MLVFQFLCLAFQKHLWSLFLTFARVLFYKLNTEFFFYKLFQVERLIERFHRKAAFIVHLEKSTVNNFIHGKHNLVSIEIDALSLGQRREYIFWIQMLGKWCVGMIKFKASVINKKTKSVVTTWIKLFMKRLYNIQDFIGASLEHF